MFPFVNKYYVKILVGTPYPPITLRGSTLDVAVSVFEKNKINNHIFTTEDSKICQKFPDK